MRWSIISCCILTLVVLAGCAGTLDDDTVRRIEILYEHTIIMDELSSPEVLTTLNLDMSKFTDHDTDALNKLTQLDAAFGITTTGSPKSRISAQEEHMELLMTEWYELTQ